MKYNRNEKDILNILSDCKMKQKILSRKRYEIRNCEMVLKKMWTESDLNFLKENVGFLSKKEIAEALGKTIHSVTNAMNRFGFKDYFIYSDKITINNLYNKLFKRNIGGYDLEILKKHNFPLETVVKSSEKEYRCVTLENFYKWYKEHIHILSLFNSDNDCLENEPDWFKEKRKADKLSMEFLQQRAWTREEDNKLKRMVDSQKYSYREIALELKRTGGAIKRRMVDLKLPKRPPKAYNHNMWSEEELKLVETLYKKGYSTSAMMYFINRSDIAINRIVEENKYYGMSIKFKGVHNDNSRRSKRKNAKRNT